MYPGDQCAAARRSGASVEIVESCGAAACSASVLCCAGWGTCWRSPIQRQCLLSGLEFEEEIDARDLKVVENLQK
eukprot:COSAG02_NODE_233_length_27847_cov_20.383055_13_plen_75_part_00